MVLSDLIQTISAGICFYAGVVHLMIGIRSEPTNRTNLSFAALSLLFGLYSVSIFALYVAFDTGFLPWYVFVDRWGIALNYLAYAALFWFIAAYTDAKERIVPFVVTSLYILIAVSNFILPYPWVYTDIELTAAFPPDIVVAPWYSVEQVVTFLLLLLYAAYYVNKQYRRGEKSAAIALGTATVIFLITLLWDYGIEYGLIDTVLMQQYGFVAFIVIMSLRLSGEAVEAEKEVRRLNVELEDRVEERTAELFNANQALKRAKEAAEAANRAKSVFLANMSHELRTPLNAILGFAQLMGSDPSLPPQHKEQLQVIDRSGEHLLDLINDVLDMSKIEAGRADLEKRGFDLHRMLESLESIIRIRAKNKGLELIFEREEEVPRYVSGDERKLRQVLLNLVGNAIKFTDEGRVTLRVGVSPPLIPPKGGEMKSSPLWGELEGGQSIYVHFGVSDTGVGINPGELDRMFEPFTQTRSDQHTAEGTGLGLPISRQFVQLMGGDISVESQVGQGSTFSFDVQLELADPSEIEPERPFRQVIGLATGGSYRVLVVDDSTDNRALLVQLLGPVGFEIREAANGQEALELYHSWQPHLIWMDVRMPMMDGYQASRAIKAGDGPDTIIIAVTASAFEEDRQQVLAAGCDDFVRKPFREQEIFEKMAEHLGLTYLYEELEPVANQEEPETTVALTAADLAALPDDWLVQVRQAASRGRSELLFDLIRQIRPDNDQIATTLTEMVNNLQFRQILDLTGQVETEEL